MAGPAKKPIRVTFFWADEAAVVQDFRAKHSEKLVEWANAFYGRYGFEMDVWPRPGGTVAEANRFCLTKSDGYELDLIGPDELLAQYKKDRDLVVDAANKINREEWTPLRAEEAAKKQQIDATLSQMASAPLAGLPALVGTLLGQSAELKTITDKLEKIRARHEELKAFADALFERYRKRKEGVDFNLPVRSQLANKVLQSIALGVAGVRTADHANIIDRFRLKVIHCRFNLSPGVLTLKRDPQPFAGTTPYSETKQGLNFNTAGGKPIWEGVFMMINTNRHEDITLAHEIVHAAGRGHITEFKRMKPASKWLTGLDPATQQVESSLYENVEDPGYYDGPPNDIINYNAKGKKPDEVILQDSDRKNLAEKAFFVIPPPTA